MLLMHGVTVKFFGVHVFLRIETRANDYAWSVDSWYKLFLIEGNEEDYRTLILISVSHFFETGIIYEGWNFNSGNYLFTTDTK